LAISLSELLPFSLIMAALGLEVVLSIVGKIPVKFSGNL